MKAMAKVTTVIFDMYETLLHNESYFWQATFDDIIREQRLNTTGDLLWKEWLQGDQEFRCRRIQPETPFQSYYDAWRECFARAFAALGLEGDAAVASRRFIHDLGQRPAYPETLEALGIIQRRWRTAVLSNADDDYLLPAVKRLGFKFDAVLSSEGVHAYKPQPALFEEILRRLGVTSQESVYVGDKQFEDVKGASQVGMGTVWINRAGAPLDANLPAPDHQISNLLELPRLLGDKAG
jgi:2-haloalkanoic acid dehalogenase type II